MVPFVVVSWRIHSVQFVGFDGATCLGDFRLPDMWDSGYSNVSLLISVTLSIIFNVGSMSSLTVGSKYPCSFGPWIFRYSGTHGTTDVASNSHGNEAPVGDSPQLRGM